MKIWIVERCINYEGCDIFGVFSTEQKAEDMKDFLYSAGHAWDRTHVIEYEIDKLPKRSQEVITLSTKRREGGENE